MSAKGKKRDSNSLDEFPNHQIDYSRLDIAKKCPRFHKLVSNEDQCVTLDELDSYQVELEIMLTDAMKRLRMLKNEYKIVDPKQNKSNEERLKRLKDSNYEKYQMNNRIASQNKTNKTNVSTSNIHDIPSRFWNYVQTFELNSSDFNPVSDYIKSSISYHPKSEKDKVEQKIQSREDAEDLVQFVIKNHVEPRKPQSRQRTRLGPCTQRLISSFVTANEHSLNGETFNELETFMERSKPQTQLQANCIEQTAFRILKMNRLAVEPGQKKPQQPTTQDDIIDKLQQRLEKQSSVNRNSMQTLLLMAKCELTKQRMQQVLRDHQKQLEEHFKKWLETKKRTGAITKSDRDFFERMVQKNNRIVGYIKSLYF